MALDIIITVNRVIPEFDEEKSISFNDDADYWYLYPVFEKLKKDTGEMIDLYDDAEFSNGSLQKLRNLILTEINNLKEMKNKECLIHTGTQTFPEKKEIYKELNKNHLTQKLKKWLDIVDLAIKSNEKIICIGD